MALCEPAGPLDDPRLPEHGRPVLRLPPRWPVRLAAVVPEPFRGRAGSNLSRMEYRRPPQRIRGQARTPADDPRRTAGVLRSRRWACAADRGFGPQGRDGRAARRDDVQDQVRPRSAPSRTRPPGPAGSAAEPARAGTGPVRVAARALRQGGSGQSAASAHRAVGARVRLGDGWPPAVGGAGPPEDAGRGASDGVADRAVQPGVRELRGHAVRPVARRGRARQGAGAPLPAPQLHHPLDRIRLSGTVRTRASRSPDRLGDGDPHIGQQRFQEPGAARALDRVYAPQGGGPR